MAIPKVEATYALDAGTVRTLERMARRWRVSKSEALRRAIRAAADSEAAPVEDGPVAALARLQQLLGLTPAAARRWRSLARAERSIGSARREGRGRRFI